MSFWKFLHNVNNKRFYLKENLVIQSLKFTFYLIGARMFFYLQRLLKLHKSSTEQNVNFFLLLFLTKTF